VRYSVLAAWLFLAIGTVLAGAPGPRSITFEERVAAQKAIEQVYWNRRIWPKDNPGPKPPLSAVMSDDAIRAKVDDYLRKSQALDVWWGRPVTGVQLQAELNRMTRNSRDGALLRELFTALDDDPALIAETLARQKLADRLVRSWYARDERFHGPLRDRAEAALASCRTTACWGASGGTYGRTTLGRSGGATGEPPASDAQRLDLETWGDAWEKGGSPAALSPAAVEETEDAFVATAVMPRRDGESRMERVTWPKRSFEAWWSVERGKLAEATAAAPSAYSLPHSTGATCADDTWREMIGNAPDARWNFSIVWTGAEMIVWGGGNGIETGGRYDPSTDTWLPTSQDVDTPDDSNWTAVWTGTEIIFWGGSGDSPTYARTGRRYDPSTNRWSHMSIGANAPLGRGAHVAVWTGSEMIIWGGYGPSSRFLATGARYDPLGDAWTLMSTTGAPIGREGGQAVWTGSEMIVWGGRSNFTAYTNSGGRYAPSTDTWTPTSAGAGVPSPRDQFTLVWTGSEMIAWGGYNGSRLGSGGRYDPVQDRWAPTSASPLSARKEHTAVWTGAEMIVWGGSVSSLDATTNTGARYDPQLDAWTPTETVNAPTGRRGHGAVWTGAEMIVWSGQTSASSTGTYSNSGGRYDPRTDSWVATSTAATVPKARTSHTAIWTGAETIVWGGNDGSIARANSGGRYDPATDTWTSTSRDANVPAGRSGHVAVWSGIEMIVWGGANDNGTFNTGGRYNPTTDSWRPTSTGTGVPSARAAHTGVWTGTEMIVWGGGDSDTGGRYRASTDSWTPTSLVGAPVGRRYHTAVWTGSEMIVWGGIASFYPSLVVMNSGGRYHPSNDAWSPTAIDGDIPSGRVYHAAVWTGSEMIVWGGAPSDNSTVFFADGGRYAPSKNAWLPVSIDGSVPVARQHPLAVWTGSEMIVWGGERAPYPRKLRTGGRYEPVSDAWTPTSAVAHAPDARSFGTAAWTGSGMMVWGGNGSDVCNNCSMFNSGSVYCAPPAGRICYRDFDGDGHGDVRSAIAGCVDPLPAGYVDDASDCDDSNSAVHPGVNDVCNGFDDDCNGLVDDNGDGADNDFDVVANSCDNCPIDSNSSQADSNHDGVGDICDLSDGLVYIYSTSKNKVEWQQDNGFTTWNVYEGDLDVLRATGTYTQVPGSNPLAIRACELTTNWVDDATPPSAGKVKFALVTDTAGGVEGGLGTNGAGVPRANTNPCP